MTTGHVLTQQPVNTQVHVIKASVLLMRQRNSWHLSNAAAENETDRLKAEIGSLRDRVDHLQTTMEEFRTRYFPERVCSPELDVAHQLEVAFTKLA